MALLSYVVLFVVVAWVVSYLLIIAFVDKTERGVFGDMFGAINSLFSGLAFAGLFFAIWLQRNQLQLQKDELALQRQELQLTRAEMQGQISGEGLSQNFF